MLLISCLIKWKTQSLKIIKVASLGMVINGKHRVVWSVKQEVLMESGAENAKHFVENFF